MGMRWQLYDPDFYTDVIFGFEHEEDESDEEIFICRCSGRGKSNEERWIPRMPCIKPIYEVQNIPITSNEPTVRKKGKGRGRMLKEKADALPAFIGSGVGCRDQITTDVHRPRREPIFLNNSSFVDKADFAVKRPNPFASLSKQVTSLAPPSSETFEEDFPSLSSSASSPYTARNRRHADVEHSISETDSRSPSLEDLNDLALVFKDSASVTCSSVSSGTRDSSPEKAVLSKSTSCRTTTSSDEAVYASDSESSYSGSSDTTASENPWSITQGNVVQLDGLPKGCDLSTLEELIAQYGTIQQTQILEYEASVAVRFRLHSEDACDWVVSCLDGTDCLFPESNRTLNCYKVGWH
ncbi:uncharacterized protein LOC110457517 [Mizuhopecten yessoensis]|uniref:Uncharacterized protein n=1 Tax=Mizuhopecten yessoensis TaxID=6573 RepID=A0A210Q8L2_MIZYE|nr:uncharacterized protein LOC110457517 [Mizuhopecten yessoensis]OWF45061.1 hypothetical protein KP79_PYT05072 [Mizuhopecten yessoensis]